jgi:hypothetical protein
MMSPCLKLRTKLLLIAILLTVIFNFHSPLIANEIKQITDIPIQIEDIGESGDLKKIITKNKTFSLVVFDGETEDIELLIIKAIKEKKKIIIKYVLKYRDLNNKIVGVQFAK